MAIAAVIAFVGVPSFKELLQNNRVATQTNRLVGSLHLARSEAVKRNAAVMLCPLGENNQCGDEWKLGWMVKVVEGGEVLQVVDVKDALVDGDTAPANIVFGGDGAVASGGQGEIIIEKASFRRKVTVRRSGSLQTCNPGRDEQCD